MRKCQAPSVPECRADAVVQCGVCEKWFCLAHIKEHTDLEAKEINRVSLDDTNITLLQQSVILDAEIPKGQVRIHPFTFCQMAAHCLRDRINGVINTKA